MAFMRRGRSSRLNAPAVTVQFSIAGVASRSMAFAAKILIAGSELFKQWVFYRRRVVGSC
jgi:hypothetical protein